MSETTPPMMKGVHYMGPSTEAADLVFDTADAQVQQLIDRVADLEDRLRAEEDKWRIRIDELRMEYREWRAIATDLYFGCICQVSDPEPDHTCNYRKAREAVRFWWKRENASG